MGVFPPATARAGEAVGPSPGEEIVTTSLLGVKPLGEVDEVADLFVSAIPQVGIPPGRSLTGGCDNIMWLAEKRD
jgi:hypothetical protein